MQLTLDAVNKKGGFVGGPVKRVVEWTHEGEKVEAEVWVRPMSYHTAMADVQAWQEGKDIKAARIAGCICHEDGSPVFRVCDITGIDDDGNPVMYKNEEGKKVPRGCLSAELTNNLFNLISEVSGLGKSQS